MTTTPTLPTRDFSLRCGACGEPFTLKARPWDYQAGDDDCPICQGEGEPKAAPVHAYLVAVYLIDRAYGGPEEGGWYYDCGQYDSEHAARMRAFGADCKGEARAYRDALQAELDATVNVGRRSISSVLSEGKYAALIFENFAPQGYPTQRPHYE